MDDRMTRSNRIETIGLVCWSLASVVLFLAVFGPPALSSPPGTTFRPMAGWPLLALLLAWWGWVPPLVLGLRQLIHRPRVYGLLSIGIGVLHCATVWLFQWLLMFRRGITWGS
jgi:hypothetical protein